MKKILIIYLVFIQIVAIGAEGKDVLEKIRANYIDLKSCSADMHFAIFRGFESTNPVEEYSGFFCRNEVNSYRKIADAEFFNFTSDGIYLQLDHDARSMYLSSSVNETMFEADLEKSLKMCGNIIVTKEQGKLAISLILSKTHDMPYNRLDLLVTEDYWIESVTMYYAAKANFSKDFNRPEMDEVKMQISYLNFKKAWSDENGKLSAANYLNLAGKKYEPTSLYKNYSIVDLRK